MQGRLVSASGTTRMAVAQAWIEAMEEALAVRLAHVAGTCYAAMNWVVVCCTDSLLQA